MGEVTPMSPQTQAAQSQCIGILGGSFNPIHLGHIMVASYLVQWGYVDQVWLTVSPSNPLKAPGELIPDVKRLTMTSLAAKGVKGVAVCDIELSMPRPSYTINTLELLAKRHPNKKFKLIIGSDNWRIFDKWKDHQAILDRFGVIVYPRPGYDIERRSIDGMEIAYAPVCGLSSTFIREAIAQGRDVKEFLPQGVSKYIIDNKLYHCRER